MNRKISIFIVVALIAAVTFAFSGCSNKSVDECKLIVEEYYDACDDYDADDIIDLMHEGFVDVFNSKEDLEIILSSRIAIYGEISEYKLVGTSYYKNNGEITVSLEYEVTYERTGDTLIERFEFLNDGEDMRIADIINENDEPFDEVPNAFFEAYKNGDNKSLIKLFADSIFSYTTEDYIIDNLNYLANEYGGFKSFEKLDELYFFEELKEDDVTVIYEGTYSVSYESLDTTFILQLCLEDDEIKINYIDWSGE